MSVSAARYIHAEERQRRRIQLPGEHEVARVASGEASPMLQVRATRQLRYTAREYGRVEELGTTNRHDNTKRTRQLKAGSTAKYVAASGCC